MSQSSRRIKPKQDRKVAVALSYERGGERAPVVTAKGEGQLAEDILRLAFANDIRVREDPDLTQVLSVVEVDCEIPLEAFAAVAGNSCLCLPGKLLPIRMLRRSERTRRVPSRNRASLEAWNDDGNRGAGQ